MKKRDFKAIVLISIFVFIFILYNFFCIHLFLKNATAITTSDTIYLFVFGNIIIILFSVMLTSIYYLFKDSKELKKLDKYEEDLEELKSKYVKYTTLVDEEIQKELNQIKKEKIIQVPKNLEKILTITNHEYLPYFEDLLTSAYEELEVEHLDSFIIAACLIYAILDWNAVTFNKEIFDDRMDDLEEDINFNIAFNCAFRLISNPITYDFENKTETQHPKVNVSLPQGISPNNELRNRIKFAILYDYFAKDYTYILQLSNLLHLIYLNSK